MYSSVEHRKLVQLLLKNRKLNAIEDRFSRMEHFVKAFSKKLPAHVEWSQTQCRTYEAAHSKLASTASQNLSKAHHYLLQLSELAMSDHKVQAEKVAYEQTYEKMMKKTNAALRYLAYDWTDGRSMSTLARVYTNRASVSLAFQPPNTVLAVANLKLAYSAVLACLAEKGHFEVYFDSQLLTVMISLARMLLGDQKSGKDEDQLLDSEKKKVRCSPSLNPFL